MVSKNKRSIFITGAGGFIGANLTRKLLERNFDIHVLARSKKISWRLDDIAKLITIHIGDLTDFSSLKTSLAKIKPKYIVHLATYGSYPFQEEIDKIVSINIEGTKNLLEASKDIPYKCFINTGSSSEYGFKEKPMKEDDFCNPVSYYAVTKLAATQLCKVFANINDKPIISLRLFSVYGPFEEPTRFIPTIIKSLILKRPIRLTAGNQRRDFVYVDDVTNAFIKALELGNKAKGKILNVGTGIERSNDDVVEHLFQVTNKRTRVEKGAYQKRRWDTPHWRADISNTKKLLKWNPEHNLTKGLYATYSWFEKNLSFHTGQYD